MRRPEFDETPEHFASFGIVWSEHSGGAVVLPWHLTSGGIFQKLQFINRSVWQALFSFGNSASVANTSMAIFSRVFKFVS